MVTSENVDFLRIFDFVGEEEADGFDALPSPIDVVPEKKVRVFWRKASILEQSEHIIVLSMYISEYFDGRFDVEHHIFFHEHILGLLSQPDNILFFQVDKLAWLSILDFSELIDDFINIDRILFNVHPL